MHISCYLKLNTREYTENGEEIYYKTDDIQGVQVIILLYELSKFYETVSLKHKEGKFFNCNS